jgi:hypothetical protein
MEKEVKQLIKESLYKRLVGHDEIDTIFDNNALVDKWITGIMALGYNDSDVELAAQDIYEMESSIYGKISIEDIRALVFLINYRFPEEVMAFTKYVELREKKAEAVVISAVEDELSFVEEGDFLLT